MDRRPLLFKSLSPESRRLINWNVGAYWLHFISFIGAVIISAIFRNGSFRGVITNDFNAHVATYQLIWVDLPFPAITATFHFLIATNERVQAIYLDSIGSPLRWTEYAITASLMTWVILQLVSVQNVVLLILAGPVANIALQAQGYMQERFRGKTRIPTYVGWFIFAAQWSIIWVYYGFVENKPWFIHSIVIGCFIWFILFGLVQLLNFSTYTQELLYIALSYTSKLYLTWNLLIAAIITGA